MSKLIEYIRPELQQLVHAMETELRLHDNFAMMIADNARRFIYNEIKDRKGNNR